MKIDHILPIVVTDRFRETRAFWVDLLGFQVTFDHEFYLGLRSEGPGTPELGFARPDADTPHRFEGKGITFALGVADADREHARLRAAGATILKPPCDQPWGARSFSVADPNGIVVVIAHQIPPAPEMAAFQR